MNSGLIAGVDEVGRGCLAGPVVAAAVILDPARPITGLTDSKLLSAARRTELAIEIRSKALYWSLGRAEPSEIDRINILRASLLAMARAVRGGLASVPSLSLRVDGRHYPDINIPGEAVVHGDREVPEISAASILAKVFRDNEMGLVDQLYPGYGFYRNKGYPSREHLEALRNLGASAIHRRSFGPVKAHLRDEALRFPGGDINRSESVLIKRPRHDD
ncbi:MAG: ribonuclease HII [Gammaproteobacteria bacterium]